VSSYIEAPQENYGSVLKDCSTALTLNPKSSKAYYRSSLALIALGRLEEALDCCDRCIEFDKDNKSILSVRERTTRVKTEKERKEQERWRRTQEENELKQRLSAAFQVRCSSACSKIYIVDITITGTKSHTYHQPT
jgi:tetratricopeptide (TPR) repeat protein